MGLLSRIKATTTTPSTPSSKSTTPLPSPSLPPSHALPISPVLSEHSKNLYSHSIDSSVYVQYPAQANSDTLRQGYVSNTANSLPSPPGSPPPQRHPYQATSASTYASQQQQIAAAKSGPGFTKMPVLTNTGPGAQQRTDRAGESQRGTEVHSQSSETASDVSNVLYNELFPNEESSGGSIESFKESGNRTGNGNGNAMEGRMKNLSIDRRGDGTNRICEESDSIQSVEMMDDLPSIDGDSDTLIQQQQEHHLLQLEQQYAEQQAHHHHQMAATAPVSSSSSSNARATGMVGTPTRGSSGTSTPLQPTTFSKKPASRYNLSDFTFIRTLGTGSFGRVHFVRSHHNNRSYAVKVLNKDKVVRMKQVEHTNSEREMLELVRHPFLVNLWGTFKDSKNLYMVMDFVAGGELFSLLRKSQRFPDPVAKFFAAEVALGLDYLHSLDIIYRDLKPENILLGADGHVKITDFGFAKRVPDITWTLCGTPDYLAPEIVQSRGYNKSVDWYALGVLMFEMLAGYPPFFTEDSNPMRLYEKIIAGKVRYPGYFSLDAKDLLKSLLTPDLTKRFGNLANGSRDIFGHVWFAEVDWQRLYKKEIPAPYTPKVEGDWDASNFDQYAETEEAYGAMGPDPHGQLFPDF